MVPSTFTSNSFDASSSNKRPLVQWNPEQDPVFGNGSTEDLHGVDSTPGHFSKKPRRGERLNQDALDNVNVSYVVCWQSIFADPLQRSPGLEPRLSTPYRSGLPSVGPQSIRSEEAQTGAGLSSMNNSLGGAAVQTSHLPSDTSRLVIQAGGCSVFRPLLKEVVESGNSLREAPASNLEPSTSTEQSQSISMMADQAATASPTSSSPKSIKADGSPRFISETDTQLEENGAAIQNSAPIRLATQHTSPTAEEDPKAWASKRVHNFRYQIEILKHDMSTRKLRITNIDQENEGSEHAQEKCLQDKCEELARVSMEIEERYKKIYNALEAEKTTRNLSKQGEVEAMNRDAVEISRMETGMQRFQGIIDFYDGI